MLGPSGLLESVVQPGQERHGQVPRREREQVVGLLVRTLVPECGNGARHLRRVGRPGGRRVAAPHGDLRAGLPLGLRTALGIPLEEAQLGLVLPHQVLELPEAVPDPVQLLLQPLHLLLGAVRPGERVGEAPFELVAVLTLPFELLAQGGQVACGLHAVLLQRDPGGLLLVLARHQRPLGPGGGAEQVPALRHPVRVHGLPGGQEPVQGREQRGPRQVGAAQEPGEPAGIHRGRGPP
ncbi:hypothetical protein [Streptomyces sp. TBY4]|uniref:hypothetical protein n=1 Tax=Streptomyces sp. TBY4 TaxID=2962030 RepID=UPI0020B89DD5|nr:hypothetical protein [Streptomyces sp. TBY4]MCP3756599.1 hypothetical protein [Streptomyces sp. TBY4]